MQVCIFETHIWIAYVFKYIFLVSLKICLWIVYSQESCFQVFIGLYCSSSLLFFLSLPDNKRSKENKLRVKIFTGCNSKSFHLRLLLEREYKIRAFITNFVIHLTRYGRSPWCSLPYHLDGGWSSHPVWNLWAAPRRAEESDRWEQYAPNSLAKKSRQQHNLHWLSPFPLNDTIRKCL